MNPAYRTAGNTVSFDVRCAVPKTDSASEQKMQSAISNDMLNEIHRLWKSAIDKITDKSRVGYVSEEDKVELYAAFHARHKDNHEPTKEVKDDRTVEAMKEYAECVGMHSANPEMMAQCFVSSIKDRAAFTDLSSRMVCSLAVIFTQGFNPICTSLKKIV